ncbi:MAG: tyrosine--tRNA ligase [Polyangiaceae bacterium]|nr:tyrosine--tRNA ligase [Polyangiaceae bacterium]
MKPVEIQLQELTRGAVDVLVRAELEARLRVSFDSGKPLRVKAGFDPTRPDLHIGHAVLMNKLRQFQDLGHHVIFLVGDFTAMVGDPTGKNEARPRLSREAVREAAETYTTQAFKILEKDKTEIRYNSEWLDKLSTYDVVELMAKTTVSRMLERKDFGERFENNRAIHQHEFLYPLLQAYDSVALDADIELGGTDQLFNLVLGRDLMERYGKRGQMVLTVPLLEGIDAKLDEKGLVVGAKMSKSADNYIGLSEEPLTIHRKVMQIDDDVIFRYYDLLSRRSVEEIATLRSDRKSGRNPMEIKALFARELIERLWSETHAIEAAAAFDKIYSKDAVPEDVPVHSFPTETATLWLGKALALSGLCKSSGEGKRLVEQGGVEVDEVRVTDGQFQLEKGKTYLVRVGSKNRRFARISVVSA